MPNPTLSDVHYSQPLTNISVAYYQDANEFIADKVFANVPVQKKSDVYWKFNKKDWFRSDVLERAPGTESVGTEYGATTDTYNTKVYAVHKNIDDQTRANADSVFKLDAQATKLVTQQLLQKRDQIWLSNFFKTSVWDTDLTGVTGTPTSGQFKRWDQPGSTPIEDVFSQKINMKEETGKLPETLVISPRVFQHLKNHAQILDRIKYTKAGGAFIDEALIAQALGVEKLLVAWAIQNTANEAQSEAMSFMAGKHALLCYVNDSPGLEQPSAGYTFSWNGYLGATAFGHKMFKMRMDHIRSDRIEGEMAFGMKKVAGDLGVFFNGVVA